MNFSEQFPILKEYTYLNTANSGLLAVDVANWRRNHDVNFIQGGSEFRANSHHVFEALRGNFSESFGVKNSNVFLSPNFSTGFHSVLNGLSKNHRVLLLADEYPSLSYPVKSFGFDYLEVAIDQDFEYNIIKSIEEFKPTIFAFSFVQYISGLQMQSNFIKELRSTYPELILIADGTQFLGTSRFSFIDSGLDALIGSGYKWLLGGYGNGYIFLSDRIKEKLYQNRQSALLPNAPFLSGRDHLSLNLEPGHLDSMNFGTLNQGLLYLKGIGFDKIEQDVKHLSSLARTELAKKGFIPEWMNERIEQSPIISLPLNQDQVNQLNGAKILASPRGTGTRISFHLYNNENDLDRLLAVLA